MKLGKIIVSATVLSISQVAYSETYSTYGNTTYGSDGTSYSQYGNTTYGSDGSSYSRYGDTLYGN